MYAVCCDENIKQMEFVQSYKCTGFNSLEEALGKLLKVDQQKVSHHSLVYTSAVMQATSEANTFCVVPGGKASLEFVVDDYADVNCVNSSDLEKIILATLRWPCASLEFSKYSVLKL